MYGKTYVLWVCACSLPIGGRNTRFTHQIYQKRRRRSTSLARGCPTAKMAATMLRSLTKLGRPSTKLILNNNLLSPGCTVLQNR